MKTISQFILYSIICEVLILILCDRCCRISSRELPKYKLIRSHGRSNQQIISRKKVADIKECRKFASAKRALAFNYGSGSDLYEFNNRDGSERHNFEQKVCYALKCPEIHNFTTFVRDRDYKYYSMYPSNVTLGTATLACVPRTGVFLFMSKSLNFTQARAVCQKANASLAHIISEERTDGLAKYIPRNMPTFVGLSNRDEERIWKNEFDEPLSCFDYRAWGAKEPSHSKGCAALVQPQVSNSSPFWKVVPCDFTLPFICELSPF
ncbi:hypothetical protein KM043_011046 [Ampulex compressa]|nr:hypothetical protein KM043_011046 [Ampulex compressa]